MNFSLGKRGQAFNWLFIIALLFVVGALYIVLNEVLVNHLVAKLGPTVAGTQFEGTGNKINFLWSYFLAVVVLVMVIWGVINSMRRPSFQ